MTVRDTDVVDDDWRDFFGAWSSYLDTFLAKRSVLSSALFPEKVAQMWFGYGYGVEVIASTTDWLSARTSPEQLGSGLRALLAPVTGLHMGGIMWTCGFATVGRLLEGAPAGAPRVAGVLDFWRRAFEVYSDPPGWRAILDGECRSSGYRLLGEGSVQDLVANLQRCTDIDFQVLGGALASYAWLLESESRQGAFSHGLYSTGRGTRLLVREFADLSGSFYAWVDPKVLDLPTGPIALVLELDESVTASFDVFGVPRLDPEAYGSAVISAAVVTKQGFVPDVEPWLAGTLERLGRAHRRLYRTVAGWGPRERFEAGVTSYARMSANVVAAGGGTDEDVHRLVLAPLKDALGDPLDQALMRTGEAAVWTWARSSDRATFLRPLFDAITDVPEVLRG